MFFDAGCLRRTPLPPVVAMLESDPGSRRELLALCRDRFNLGERKADDVLKQQREFLSENQRGHEKVFELNPERVGEAPLKARFAWRVRTRRLVTPRVSRRAQSAE